MKTLRVIICQGIPASGKTTWAKAYSEKNKDWIRISRDDLRHMRGKYWIPKDESIITEMERSMISVAFNNDKHVIIDATNISHLDGLKQFISDVRPGVQIEVKKFEISLDTAIKRDLARSNSVGAEVITRMYNKLNNIVPVVYKEDMNLQQVVICDIDGTVAEMHDRIPYDWDKVINDSPKTEIIEIVKGLKDSGNKIIFFTARDGNDECRRQTIEWLEIHFGWKYKEDFELYMRDAGDMRKDSIVKKEMFEAEIRDKYYCKMVIDDRNQVISLWRDDLGLVAIQVAEGNF